MKYIADLHIHSYFSRATSKSLNLEHLNKWAQIKGLKVVATGDITHPRWLEEMREKLEPAAGDGLFTLKPEFIRTTQAEVPAACAGDVYFILSGEISSIYKKGKVRKIHNVVFFPSFDSVARFQATLDRIGNIRSDGRPILGLDARDLLEIVLETDADAQLIPAHIWTPWFSLLGSKSGFDSVQECFDDLSCHIFALETGLSSDPPMNWRLSSLDTYSLVSNSDAHSPENLAREANVFETDLSYKALFAALKNKSQDFWGTIEFFPEEGKYHMDGHRKCGKMMRPTETIENHGLCPVCGKPATLGVNYRVEELADRPEGARPEGAKSFLSLIPLPEVLSEVLGVGPKSKKVQRVYFSMLQELGPELSILMDLSIKDIEAHSGGLVAEAVRRMRAGEVHPMPGYDGEYGIIRIFDEHEKQEILQQGSLFSFGELPQSEQKVKKESAGKKPIPQEEKPEPQVVREDNADAYGLNEQQRQAVRHRGSPLIIQAGPGTGKTRTLTYRLASLIDTGDAAADEILAVTFTNKAAGEMRERLEQLVGAAKSQAMTIQTFHAFGASLLRQTEEFFGRTKSFVIIDPGADADFQEHLKKLTGKEVPVSHLERISRLKSQLYAPDTLPKEIVENTPEALLKTFEIYERALIELNAVDYEDLIALPVKMLRNNPDKRRELLQTYRVIAVDEFQDINRAQYELFLILALTARDVCVIGDPDQAIYGFRGASREFFRRFTEDFPHARYIRLNRNYRSTQNILQASVQILGQEKSRDPEQIWSNISSQVKIRFYQAATDRAEAEFVVHQIEQLIGGTSYFSIDTQRVDDRGLPEDYTFSDIAILVRSKQIAPPIIEALSRSGIPFDTFETVPLVTDKVTSVVSALLKFAFFADGEKPLASCIPEFFLPADAIIEMSSGEKSGTSLAMLETQGAQGGPEVQELVTLLKTLREHAVNDSVAGLLEIIFQSPTMRKYVQSSESNALLRRLLDLAQPFANRVDRFLDALILQRDVDVMDKRGDQVRVMTMHACKGLEFPVVFIVGCEENILPFKLPGRESDVDEERRLLYVAMTRAQRLLVLTHAKSRVLYGQRHQQRPSRFLQAISDSLLQKESQSYSKRKDTQQLSLF